MKRIIALLLVIVLIFTGATGCKKKNKVEDSATNQGQITSEEGDISGNATGNATGNASGGITVAQGVPAPIQTPVGVWDIPIPDINPLGAQDLYLQTDYESGSHELRYIENYAEYQKYIDGEVWRLYIADTSQTALASLATYAKSIGATVMDSQYDDRLIFSLVKDGDSLWWGDAVLNSDGYELDVIKQQEVPVGKEITFQTSGIDTELNKISFVTRSGGKMFQTMTVQLPDGEVYLEADEETYTRMIERRVSYREELSAKKTNKYVLDNIPQGEGVFNWDISWNAETKPSQITISLEETLEIPYVKRGDELGALKVKDVPFGSVTVEPAGEVSYEYADGYSLEADITPEGDSLFWLPSGLWNVYLSTQEAGFAEGLTRLVPVSAGELTEVTFPKSLKSAYNTLNSLYAEPENVTGGIIITEAADKSTTGVVSLMVEDPKKRDVFPDKVNTTIMESGQTVEIVDITRQIQPPSIVLVLDSSGSMEKAMDNTLIAAKTFISGLPDKTFIKVVDFDTEVRVLKGETKDAVLKNISKIKADGYTTLFDATITGLKLLVGKDRPALVVFSDGADSSTDGSGKGGSSASKEDVALAATEAGIPLYTIGFGDAPDETALKTMANASGGQYYSAKDKKALDNVFTAINSKFGNYFTMTYNRPKEADNADTPVVAMVIDASGSMNIDPAEEEDCGFRIDKVKAIFHDFVLKLPEQCLMQLISFQTQTMGGNLINLEQITTLDKANVLQAIGEMKAGGGTPILESIRMAFENLKTVPSNNKIIVFLTDAALEVEEEEQELFDKLLAEIKEENITVLFAGMGVDDKVDVFKKAAQLSGGRYVISEDAKVLNATLEEILGVIKEGKVPDKLPLSITISDKASSGESLNYTINTTVKFSIPPKSGKIIEPEPVKVVTGKVMKRYDLDVAKLLTGTSVPSEETILTQRMDMDATGSNQGMKMSIKEAFQFSIFKGLSPDNKQFMALRLELKNIHSDKIQYQIPNMSSHFYININNEGMYPASEATWLTEEPLTNPGNYEINVFPDKDLSGMLMFVVPEEPITQMSLHFYDTNYGHIDLALVGMMDQKLLQLKKLPTEPPVNIADSFTMAVTATSDVPTLDIYEAPKNTSFRVIEAEFKSNVQALLNIDPSERLWMKTETAMGPLMVKMSDITKYTPFGFMKPRMLGPASSNKVRMVYPIANALTGVKTEIFGDILESSLSVPVIKGSPYGGKSNKTPVAENGIKVRVNNLTTLEGVNGYGENWVVADLTIIDEKDGWGTWITPDFFKLVQADYVTDLTEDSDSNEEASAVRVGLGDFAGMNWESSDYEREPDYTTRDLLYGIDDDWGVFDNSQRRGFVIFTTTGDDVDWVLTSPYVTTLKEKLKYEKYPDSSLLVDKFISPEGDEEYEEALEAAVDKAILLYQATKSAYGDAGYTNTVSLEKGDGKNNIPVPTISYYGAVKIKEVKTLEEALQIMQGLRCILKDYNELQYSPEAVITQSWGSQWDLANLAMGLVAKNGFVPTLRTVGVTETGRSKLYEMCGLEEGYMSTIPGVSYIDQNGISKIFVIPFMKDISELKGLVYLPSNPESAEYSPNSTNITVSVKVEMDETTAQSLTGDIGEILGGGGEDGPYYDYIQLLTKEVSMPDLSRDAIEIGYMKADIGKGMRYMAAISTIDGIEGGKGIVDTGVMKLVGLKIEIELPGGIQIYETTLKEDEELDKIMHTIAINLPDLTEEAAVSLEGAFTEEYKAAKNPNSMSALKWYGRNVLNRFINAQSTYDRAIGEDLNLTMGRTTKARCIMVTSRVAKDNKLRTTIDLMQASNQCHNGEEGNITAYNLSSGMFMSSLEASALTGEDKISYLDLWGMASEDTSLMFIMDDSELRSLSLEAMKAAGNFPAHMIERIENSEKVIITMDKPILYKGEERWAWLEIDPYTYETISVFDTGEHAGMAEYTFSLQPTGEDCGKYIVGAFIGVEVGVWSLASSSLKLSDYDEIIADAMENAKGIGEHLEKVMSGIDAVKNKEYTYTALSIGGERAANYNIKVKWNFDVDLDLAQNIIGFEQGFNDGLSVYFTYVRYGNGQQ